MQSTQFSISSIICFNSGSAGDFLLTLCLSQLDSQGEYYIDNNGAVNLHTQYFKDITRDIFYGHSAKENIDFTKVRKVENTHFYLDWYPHMCENMFYIDYPDNLQYKILEAVKKKRHKNSWRNFLQYNKIYLPNYFQGKLTEKDVINVFVKQWNKNLTGWRCNPLMTSISFLDLFEIKNIKTIIQTINRQPCRDIETLKTIHANWLEKNQDLI